MRNKLILIIGIFVFAFSIRLLTINDIGRTWDEMTYVALGRNVINLMISGKYFKEIERGTKFPEYLWYELPDPPPLARYIYGIFSLGDVQGYDNKGQAILNYDMTYSRIASALFGSLTVIFIILLGFEFFSPYVAISAGIIFSMLPFFVGLSQVATVESFIMFTFTASTYMFIKTLQRISFKKIILTGIIAGFALLTKYTNVFIFPLFLWIYGFWYFSSTKKTNNKKYNILFIFGLIILVSIITFIALWPLIWFHYKEIFEYEIWLRYTSTKYPIPEVFFGRLMFVPKIYFLVQFLLTTPVLVLSLFILGLYKIFKIDKDSVIGNLNNNKWVYLSLIAWFVIPFLQSFYNFRQHGVRYIIQIYAPLSLISAIGLEFIVSKISKKTIVKWLSLGSVFIYLMIILLNMKPYYFDYFNELVGGAKNVSAKKSFQLGWWGEGQSEAFKYLVKNAPYGSRIGKPFYHPLVFPSSNRLIISEYEKNKDYDYVVVGYFDVVRNGFNDAIVKEKYKTIYNVKADGANIVTIYKRTN